MKNYDLIIHQAERIMKLSFDLKEVHKDQARDIAEELMGISQSLKEGEQQIKGGLKKVEESLKAILK